MKKSPYIFLLCLIAFLFVVQGASAQQYVSAPLNPAFVSYAGGEEAAASEALYDCQALSDAEGSPYPLTGLIPAPSMPVWSDVSATSAALGALPATFDLRDEGRLTAVRDQGKCGSCWAFATYASLESSLLTDTGFAWDFSENNMKNLCSNLYGDFDCGPCDGGQAFMSTAYLARWSGPLNESDDPYALPMPSNDSPTDLSPVVHIGNITFLPPRADSLDNDLMKEAIRDQGALWIGFTVNWSCFADNYLTYYRPGDGTYKSNGGHAVALVGWDDNYPAANFSVAPPGNGAFIVKNSWGEGVGDGGYFYISYYEPELARLWGENSTFIGDDRDFASVLFTGEAADILDNVYQYDPLGWTASIGTGDTTTLYGANVFTADGYEDLRSVSFYTREPGTDYVVAVFRAIDTPPGNASGPVTWISGTAALPGYHTIPLPEAVSLSPGRTFSVVLKVAAPTDTCPLVVEKPIAGYSSNAVAEPGEGYVSVDGDRWDDLAGIFSNTSVCIKAFTTDAVVVPRDYATIQEAVDAAGIGETVWVESGTYDGCVVVNKTISLLGIDTGAGLPTIDPGDAYYGVSIEANDTVFEGFSVVRSGEDAYEGTGVLLEGDNISMHDVAVTGNEIGVSIGDVSALTLNNTSMAGNLYNLEYFCGNPSPGNDIDTGNTVDGRPVVYLEGVSDVTVGAETDAGAVICVNTTDVAVRDLSLDNLAYGIFALDTQGLTVTNTTFGNVTAGVYARQSEDLTLLENRFGPNVGEGIVLEICSRTQVEGNVFDNVGDIGVYSVLGQDQVISENTLAGSPSFGIAMFSSSGCEISGNTINSSLCGIYTIGSGDGDANLLVTDNVVTGDPMVGVLSSSVDNLTLTGNTLSGVLYGIAVLSVNVTIADNQVGYGDGGVGIYLATVNASVTGNRVEGAGTMTFLEGSNVLMTENTFTGAAYPVGIVDNSSAYFSVYLNNFLLDDTGAAASASAMATESAVAGMPDPGRIFADLPSGIHDPAFEAAMGMCSEPAFSCGVDDNGAVVSWHSPTELTYWYRQIGYTNFTGNYWSSYEGTDANGDGIGDTPFAISGNETDLYPLMERFEAYPKTPLENDGGSSSEGDLAASGNLNAGATASLQFRGSAVTGITVTAAQRIDGIMVTIAPAGSGPAGLDAPVYQYLVANLTYTTDDAIAEAVFTFDVPASWLEEQGLSPQDVALWRYHDGVWVSLPTEVIGTEGGRIFYRAVSPGFSYFAVAGGAAALPVATETVPAAGSETGISPAETVSVAPVNASAPGSPAAVGTEETPSPAATTTQQSPLVFAPLIALGALLVLRRR